MSANAAQKHALNLLVYGCIGYSAFQGVKGIGARPNPFVEYEALLRRGTAVGAHASNERRLLDYVEQLATRKLSTTVVDDSVWGVRSLRRVSPTRLSVPGSAEGVAMGRSVVYSVHDWVTAATESTRSALSRHLQPGARPRVDAVEGLSTSGETAITQTIALGVAAMEARDVEHKALF